MRHLLRQAGWSQRALSRATGIAYATLGRKIAGRSEFTMGELLAVAEALGVSPAVLVDSSARRPSDTTG